MYSITNAISEPIGNTRYCITFQMADAQWRMACNFNCRRNVTSDFHFVI
jgi:hypothetical protein